MIILHLDPLPRSALSLMITAALILSFAMLGSHWLKNHVYAFSLQSWMVGLISATVGYYGHLGQLYVIAALTVIFRGTILPYLLVRLSDRLGTEREFSAIFRPAFSMVLGAMLVIAAFVVGISLSSQLAIHYSIATIALSSTFGLLFIGLEMMILRTEALSHILGLLVMENGIFLGSQVLTPGLPFLLELVILFDLLVIVATFGMLVRLLKFHAGSTSSKDLQRLVG